MITRLVVVALLSRVGKDTVGVSFDLFHFNTSIAVSVKSSLSCCFGYVSSSLSATSSSFCSISLALEFNLCNLNKVSSKTSTAFYFRFAACAMVCPPVSTSSSYKFIRSPATMSLMISLFRSTVRLGFFASNDSMLRPV